LDQLVGILPVRRLLASMGDQNFDEAALLQLAGPLLHSLGNRRFSQLAFFQENRQRIGFVVDEYGEILGLLTWKTSLKSLSATSRPHSPDSIKTQLDADRRRHRRRLTLPAGHKPHARTQFPARWPENPERAHSGTLSGHSRSRYQHQAVNGIAVEILQTQDRSVVTVRIFRPETGIELQPTTFTNNRLRSIIRRSKRHLTIDQWRQPLKILHSAAWRVRSSRPGNSRRPRPNNCWLRRSSAKISLIEQIIIQPESSALWICPLCRRHLRLPIA
jgi:hypothetical protein